MKCLLSKYLLSKFTFRLCLSCNNKINVVSRFRLTICETPELPIFSYTNINRSIDIDNDMSIRFIKGLLLWEGLLEFHNHLPSSITRIKMFVQNLVKVFLHQRHKSGMIWKQETYLSFLIRFVAKICSPSIK